MKLVTYRRTSGGPSAGALLPSAHIADLRTIGREVGLQVDTVKALLELGEAAWQPLAERLNAVDEDPAAGIDAGWIFPEAEVELLPPTGPRPFILGCGGIFASHLKEMGVPPVPNPQPDGYIVNPNIVIGSGQPIILPEFAPDQVDFEGELCVVFGRPTYGITADEAMEHVAGYTIYNDVSARNLNAGFTSPDPAERVASYAGIIRYKGFPTFGPLGPCITTRDELTDIEKSRLVTTVNDQVMQDDLIGNLAMSIAEVVERVTRFHSFGAGDVMTLGTPAGVGYARTPRVYLAPGDIVEIAIDGIGTLRNPVAAAAGNKAVDQ